MKIIIIIFLSFFLITPVLAADDADKDGLIDSWEIIIGTDTNNPDSDSDGFKDGLEVTNGYSPLSTSTIKLEKKIEVDEKKLSLKYYFDNKLLETIPVSTGKKSTPTPLGSFAVLKKFPIKHWRGPGYDYPNGKWNLMILSNHGLNYYIHGAYWHNQFGKARVSAGCINVAYSEMEKLYNFSQIGTKVKVY